MSKFDEALESYKKEMKQTLGMSNIEEGLLQAVTKGLGPSIYREDASKVSCSDPEELARVKKNFLINKLGLQDGPELDKAIQEVCEQFGSSNRRKFRAIFYYLLTKKFGKESIYA
jgi:hypothetical protein